MNWHLILNWTIFFIILIAGFLLLYKLKNKNNKKPKSVSSTTTGTPHPPPPTRKKTDWWGLIKSILWMLFILFLVILIGVWIAQGVKKLLEPKQKTKTERKSVYPVYKEDYYLEKGKSIVIQIKPGYSYCYKDYGKVYFHQSFYGNKSGPIKKSNDITGEHHIGVTKVIISVYEKEGIISVFYSKDINKIKEIINAPGF